MKPELDAVLEANKNLTKKIKELEEQNKELFWFKEKFVQMEKSHREMEKQLQLKRDVVRVLQLRDGANYVLQITKVQDTPEGMYIEVI